MIDWLIDTIRYLSNRDDIEVVVRAHPVKFMVIAL